MDIEIDVGFDSWKDDSAILGWGWMGFIEADSEGGARIAGV